MAVHDDHLRRIQLELARQELEQEQPDLEGQELEEAAAERVSAQQQQQQQATGQVPPGAPPMDLRDLVRELARLRMALARPHPAQLAATILSGDPTGSLTLESALVQAHALLDMESRMGAQAQPDPSEGFSQKSVQ